MAAVQIQLTPLLASALSFFSLLATQKLTQLVFIVTHIYELNLILHSISFTLSLSLLIITLLSICLVPGAGW